MTRNDFNNAYWAAQPPEVRALRDMLDRRVDIGASNQEIEAKCIELAMAGFKIDAWIHVWAWEPYQSMWLRQRHGYTWWPTILQPGGFDLAPGIIGMPGSPYDPKRPLPGSIVISTDLADYPPFDQPEEKPELKTPQGVPGVVTLAGRYRGIMPGDESPIGTRWTDPVDGAVWEKKMGAMIPVPSVWWQRVS